MGGKAKGSAWEREISVALSKWWTNDASDSVFWRTSSSGGRATVRHSKGRDTPGASGDICAADPIGQPLLDVCSIELKRGYSSNSIADVLDMPSNAKACAWLKFYQQVKESQEQSGAFSWLILWKRDRREAIVFMPQDLYDELLCRQESWEPNKLMVLYDPEFGEFGVVAITLKQFFTAIPEVFREISKEQRNAPTNRTTGQDSSSQPTPH